MDSDKRGQIKRANKPLSRTDVENLLREVSSPKELNLSDQNLSGIDLSNFDLTGATLEWSDLTNANLSGATLNEASLLGAILRKANLSGAKLRKAVLRDAILNTYSQQEKTSLSKTNLEWAILCRLNLKTNETDLRRTDMSDVNLSRADLSEADLRGTNLQRASLIEAELSGADLSKTDLREADLSGAFLSEANLREADLSGADLHQSTLTMVNLSGADLSAANLSGADLSAANLSGADLSAANLSETSLMEANLNGVTLNGATLHGALISESQEALLRDTGVISLDEKSLFVGSLDSLEGIVSTSTIHIRIIEEPLTAHNLASIISALTEFSTKCWLIGKRRLADLIEYTQTHNARFDEEVHIVIIRVMFNSPFNMDWKVDVSVPSVAEAIVTTIDGIVQRKSRLEKAVLENQAKAQEIKEAEQKADQVQQMALIEREKQELEIERQRLELLEKRLEVQKKGIEYALEIANKTVDILYSSADVETREMLIQTLLPNILQLQNGKGLELALPAPQNKKDEAIVEEN